MNFLALSLWIAGAWALAAMCIGLARKKRNAQWLPRCFRAENRGKAVEAAVRIGFWAITSAAVALAIVPAQFSPSDLRLIAVISGGALLVHFLAAVVRGERRNWPLNVALGMCLLVVGWQCWMATCAGSGPKAKPIRPPFAGQWLVVQGADSFLTNHHHFSGSQRYAVDLILPQDARMAAGRRPLSSYSAFGAPVLAPFSGEVVRVAGESEDQEVGSMDFSHPAGNLVVLRHPDGCFFLVGHLQKGSIAVRPGEQVGAGQLIGRCGNSGTTSQPHLHLQLMTQADYEAPGNKPLPMVFRNDQEGSRPLWPRRNLLVAGVEGSQASRSR